MSCCPISVFSLWALAWEAWRDPRDDSASRSYKHESEKVCAYDLNCTCKKLKSVPWWMIRSLVPPTEKFFSRLHSDHRNERNQIEKNTVILTLAFCNESTWLDKSPCSAVRELFSFSSLQHITTFQCLLMTNCDLLYKNLTYVANFFSEYWFEQIEHVISFHFIQMTIYFDLLFLETDRYKHTWIVLTLSRNEHLK